MPGIGGLLPLRWRRCPVPPRMEGSSDRVHWDVPDFSNSVLSHLNRLRLQGRLCDIVVSVEGQGFRAHKVVLAASSPYFRDHMALGQMSTVSLGVIRQPRVFEQLLSFCYTGRLSLQLTDIVSYLTAASFLQMQHVIDRCTQLLEGIHLKIHLGDAGARGLRGPGEGEEKEPRLRVDQEGQWYVESSGEQQEEEEPGGGGLHIKTERMEEWLEEEEEEEEDEEEEEEEVPGAAEEEATTLIHRSGRSSLVQDTVVSGPSSSQTDRFSPTDSVVILTEHQRAKSESPGRDDTQQPSSQGEEPAALDMGGYEEYLREQVGDRWFRYNPRLTCIYCCKSFNQKGSLDRHMRLHMGITPFVCRICGKKYTRKDQLEYHIRKHTGNKPFHCYICGKSFPFQAILNQHFRKNHPGCTPQEVAHSASPETTTASSSGAGQNHDSSPGQDHRDRGGTEGPQASVSTTGPD
ncbi:Zinc finger and BTB domain-containing protein 37 [Merluccius polli]|uniref:Zinc finger and BTB domain-containing protein 37 n=1 Tax=Merluccius polli TaxID=89951 RepID=A0AA47MRG0_MERPO|nr:Zinc finger and BTB domain-containing protein 37 [Merluccius polli]